MKKNITKALLVGAMLISSGTVNCSYLSKYAYQGRVLASSVNEEVKRRALHVKDIVKDAGSRSLAMASRHKIALGTAACVTAAGIAYFLKYSDYSYKLRRSLRPRSKASTSRFSENPSRHTPDRESLGSEGLAYPKSQKG